MNRLLPQSLVLALFVSVAGTATSNAQIEVSASYSSPGTQINMSYFYDDLSPDGEWIQEPSYGWCWTPYDMSADWRPYYNGHWEYTNYGWSWASDERFGWATYHYGRWLFDDSYGWVWVPGTEWAPAWVAWRTGNQYGDQYVGWAPLPPTAGWNVSAGLSFNDVNSIRTDNWCFVPQARMLDVNISVQVTSVARNVTLVQSTQNATRFEVRDGRPANVGIDVAVVEKSVGRPVPQVKIVDVDSPASGSGRRDGKGSVGYYRPAVQAAAPEQAPPQAVIARQDDVSPADLQRQRDTQQRELDKSLKAQQDRLAREHQSELRGQKAGPSTDEMHKRQAAEQQAFTAYAAQQHKVLDQRVQKKIVKPDKAKATAKPKEQAPAPSQSQSQGQGKGQNKGQTQGKGQAPDSTQGKGNGK